MQSAAKCQRRHLAVLRKEPKIEKQKKTKTNIKVHFDIYACCPNVQLNVYTEPIQSAAPLAHVQDWSGDDAARRL